MALFYSFVSRGTCVLAEHAASSGNWSQVALEIVSKLTGKESRFTYKAQEYLLNFLLDGGLTYLVVCEEGYPREICFYFLEQVQKEFKSKFEDKSKTATAHAFDRTFGPRLKHYMDYCVNNPGEISKVHRVKAQVDEVKNVMVQNIEKVLDRGERIEVLVDKTEDLRNQATKFQKQSRNLRNKMWWQNMKMKLLVVGAILLLALVIFLIVCFSGACWSH